MNTESNEPTPVATGEDQACTGAETLGVVLFRFCVGEYPPASSRGTTIAETVRWAMLMQSPLEKPGRPPGFGGGRETDNKNALCPEP